MDKKTKNHFKALWSIICKNASVDQQTNQLSIFNVLEEVSINKTQSSALPGQETGHSQDKILVPFEHSLVVLLERNISETEDEFISTLVIEIIDSENKVLIPSENQIKFETGKSRLRIIITLNVFAATKPGVYTYKISEKRPDGSLEKKSDISLNVKING